MEHTVLLSVHAVEVIQGPADPLAVLTKGLFRPHRYFCLPAAGCCFLKCAFQTKKERGQRAQRLLRSSRVLFFFFFLGGLQSKTAHFPKTGRWDGVDAPPWRSARREQGGADSLATSAQPLGTGASWKKKWGRGAVRALLRLIYTPQTEAATKGSFDVWHLKGIKHTHWCMHTHSLLVCALTLESGRR